MNSMEPAERESTWRRVIVILCAIALVFSAYAVYRVKKFEAESTPRIHLIQAVTASR
jgi:hypothetical protein